MTDPHEHTHATSSTGYPDRSRLTLDWVDLLVVLGTGYAGAGLLYALELDVRASILGAILSGPCFAALALRRRLAPRASHAGVVKRKLTLLGLLSTSLLVFGLLVAVTGGFILFDAESDALERVSDHELGTRAETLALVEQLGALSDTLEVVDSDTATDDVQIAGGLEELMQAVDSESKRRAAEIRVRLASEAETERLAQQEERRSNRLESGLLWGLVGALAIVIGGFLDSRRPVVAR